MPADPEETALPSPGGPGWLSSSHFTSTKQTGARLPIRRWARCWLRHLSADNASDHGVTIQAEAVINDAHALYLIVQADSRDPVERFMAPFAQADTLEVLPASSREAVIGREGCASTAA